MQNTNYLQYGIFLGALSLVGMAHAMEESVKPLWLENDKIKNCLTKRSQTMVHATRDNFYYIKRFDYEIEQFKKALGNYSVNEIKLVHQGNDGEISNQDENKAGSPLNINSLVFLSNKEHEDALKSISIAVMDKAGICHIDFTVFAQKLENRFFMVYMEPAMLLLKKKTEELEKEVENLNTKDENLQKKLEESERKLSNLMQASNENKEAECLTPEELEARLHNNTDRPQVSSKKNGGFFWLGLGAGTALGVSMNFLWPWIKTRYLRS
jgi:hypothetical protein